MGCFTSQPDVLPKGRPKGQTKREISLNNITMILRKDEGPKFFSADITDFYEDPGRLTRDLVVNSFLNKCESVTTPQGNRLYIAILKKDNIYFTYGGKTTITIHDRWISDRGSHLEHARSIRPFSSIGPTFDDIWGTLQEPYNLYIMMYKNNVHDIDVSEKNLIKMLCENQSENILCTNIQHTNKMRNRQKILEKLQKFT